MTLRSRQHGFTLLELLVVMVIAGLMLGAVAFNAMPSPRQRVEQDANRIALLLQLARDEAILRNLPVAFEADQYGYRFQVREDRVWLPLRDDMLRDRAFDISPLELSMEPPSNQAAAVRIVFGREPVDKPFIITLRVPDGSVRIRADGVGHFFVE